LLSSKQNKAATSSRGIFGRLIFCVLMGFRVFWIAQRKIGAKAVQQIGPGIRNATYGETPLLHEKPCTRRHNPVLV